MIICHQRVSRYESFKVHKEFGYLSNQHVYSSFKGKLIWVLAPFYLYSLQFIMVYEDNARLKMGSLYAAIAYTNKML